VIILVGLHVIHRWLLLAKELNFSIIALLLFIFAHSYQIVERELTHADVFFSVN